MQDIDWCTRTSDKAETIHEATFVTRDKATLLYTLLLVQRNRWFANSDVPFQSVTNDLLHSQFVMQTYVLHQVDVTSELSCSAHAQSNNKTINVWLFM